MDARQWLGLEPTHNPLRWYLPVVPGISAGGAFLFGGCALAASIEAMEAATDRPVIWATGQYLSYARPPDVMDIDVTVASSGRYTTQARAIGRVRDTEIVTVNAALGSRSFPTAGQWVEAPDVEPPERCAPREPRRVVADSIMRRLDQRWALRDPVQGRTAVWTRMPDLLSVSATSLAVLGDYVPLGLSEVIDGEVAINSLDNTLRVANVVSTEWVLVDINVDLINHGFGHGVVHLWATDGTLMATASQSAIIRTWKGP